MNNKTCQLKKPPFFQCCCTCAYHTKDYGHPSTNGMSISEQRGWICTPPMIHGSFSNWPEHSAGCEMHTTNQKLEEYNKPYSDFKRRRGLLLEVWFYVKCFIRHTIKLDKKKHIMVFRKNRFINKKLNRKLVNFRRPT